MEKERDLENRLKQFLHRFNDNQDRKKPSSPEIEINQKGVNTRIGDIENDLNTPPKRKTKELFSKSEEKEEKTNKNFEKIEKTEKIEIVKIEEIEKKPKNLGKSCENMYKHEKKGFFENLMKKNMKIEKKTKDKMHLQKTPEKSLEKKAIFLSEKRKKDNFSQNNTMKNPENLSSYGISTKELDKIIKSTFIEKNSIKASTEEKKLKKTPDFFKESSEKLENLSNNLNFK